MSTVPAIVPGSITGIDGLVKRPVYFLKLNNGAMPSLVVKGDSDKDDHAAVSIAWGSKVMKNVQNKHVNTKIMTAAEITAFKNAVLRNFQRGTPQLLFMSESYTWVKMPYVPGVTDADFVNDDATVNLKAIKEVIKRMSDAQVWHDLGIVVAADIFNGNSDRFVVEVQDTRPAGTWSNRGNIMFLGAGHGHTTRVTGLDTFDPNSPVNNLRSGGGFEGLKALINPIPRNEFAKQAVRSVASQMKNWLRNEGGQRGAFFSIATQGDGGPGILRIEVEKMETLFDEYATDFAQGMTTGSTRLKAYLERKCTDYGVPLPNAAPRRPLAALPGEPPRRPTAPTPGTAPNRPQQPLPGGPTIPQGILDRMKYLGWL
jgi:hypothetical protein